MKNNIYIDLDENFAGYIKDIIKDEKILKDINKIVEYVTEDQGLSNLNLCVSIQMVSKEKIKDINLKYRGKDSSTDVLSFPIFERNELFNIVNESNESKKIKEIELGDIILCLDVIEEHAKEYDTGIVREILYMITHAMCHLLGYDHIEEDDKKEMRLLEEKILEKVGVVR